MAPQSPPVVALAALQRLAAARASGPLPREVDTSSSPFLPDYADDETPAWEDDSEVAGWAAAEYRGEGVDRATGPALPDYAEDETPGWADGSEVADWAAAEYRGESVDNASGPGLPDYAADETPGWAREQGIPDWAKEDFIAPTLIASMTPDGKIGSIYFDDGNRIRTTHGSGPEKSDHSDTTTKQFNISRSGAEAAFDASAAYEKLEEDHNRRLKAAAQLRKKADREARRWRAERKARAEYKAAKKQFIKEALRDATADAMPSWAKPVSGPEMAVDTARDGLPGEDDQLFEIFLDEDGELAGSHPSRGAAVKIETDSNTVAVLREAATRVQRAFPANIRKMKGQAKIDEAYRRNRMFYDYVVAHAPAMAAKMRTPEDIRDG